MLKCPVSAGSSAFYTFCPAFLGAPWLSLRQRSLPGSPPHLATTCFPSWTGLPTSWNALPATHQQVAARPTDCWLGSLRNLLKSKFPRFPSGNRHQSIFTDEESGDGEKMIHSCSSSSGKGLSPTGVSDGSLTRSRRKFNPCFWGAPCNL